MTRITLSKLRDIRVFYWKNILYKRFLFRSLSNNVSIEFCVLSSQMLFHEKHVGKIEFHVNEYFGKPNLYVDENILSVHVRTIILCKVKICSL